MSVCCAVVSNLSLVPTSEVIGSSQAHPTHLGTPFRLRAPARYPAGYPRRSTEEPITLSPVSRCLSATGLRFLGRPTPAEGSGLPHGRLAGRRAIRRSGPQRGYRVAHGPDTTGVDAPSTPRRRCPPSRSALPGRRLPLPSGQSYTPLPQPIGGVNRDEASSGVHSRSPVRSSPHLLLPDGTRVLGLEP